MDNLWAPWRMTYILGQDKTEGCIFCLDKEGPDKDRLVLFADEVGLVMMNRYPYNNGHLLIAPRRHVSGLDDLSPDEVHRLMALQCRALAALEAEMNPDGFNIGLNLGRVAGAGIETHLHYHIVPRWSGDVNYMTVLAEVRVVPEHLEATFDRLVARFQEVTDARS